MLTPAQLKLYELLKTDEQVKGLMEQIKEGCLISWEGEILKFVGYGTPSMNGNHECILLRGKRTQTIKKDKVEIIGLPLSEHFIRLYCINKGIYFDIVKELIQIKGVHIEIDNTRDFNSQSDECYNSICEALINL